MHMDIFNDDAFSVVSLTKAIEDTPFVPGRVGQLGIFSEEGVSTTSISSSSPIMLQYSNRAWKRPWSS